MILTKKAHLNYIQEIQWIYWTIQEEKKPLLYGILKDIDAYYNYHFSHYCCTEKGSSGSPIFSLSDNKIFGLHRGSSKFNFNEGTFIKNPIQDFISKNKNKGGFVTFNSCHPQKLKFSNLNSKKLFLKKSINEKKEIIKVKIGYIDKITDKKEMNISKINKVSKTNGLIGDQKLPEINIKQEDNTLLKLLGNFILIKQ